ncbi:fibrinogen-like protein A [Saccostrea cucullata]|uniref:fibrinogen-like protein A n=1 Tax=Saccostrea cuccullata TaxID=36930 RepID=UPI002ED17748
MWLHVSVVKYETVNLHGVSYSKFDVQVILNDFDCGVGPPSILHDVVIHYVDNNKGSTARLKCKDYVRFSEGSGHAVCTNQGKWQVDLNCSVPLDCKELYDKYDVRESGPHYISPDKTSGILANCDMTTEGGGWTIIQRRINPDLDFYKSWSEYKTGFGNISSNFWLGNDALHALTATPNTLRFVLTDFSNNVKYADYKNVEVKDEQDHYRLNFEEYLEGNAGNALKGSESKYWAYGMQFSTHDMDNDNLDSVNCGSYMKGGWWYNSCTTSNLNGVYCESSDRHNCMTWSESDDYSELRVGHKETVIMIRRTV